MAAANHGKRIGAGKIRRAFHFADGFLAGIDQIAIFLALDGIGANPQHAILGLENHIHARRHMVGHQGGHADAEIDIEAVAQFAGNALHDALAFVGIFHKSSRWSLVVGRWS